MRVLYIVIAIVAVSVITGMIYYSQLDYKYSCQTDAQCYPCTRWMNCVSEDFYLRNTVKCRMGGEENFTRISCGCAQTACVATHIAPEGHASPAVWVPQE